MIRPAVVAALRTPFAPLHGGLAAMHPVDLLAELLAALDTRTGIAAEVDAVIIGCASPVGGQGDNVGRAAMLAAGWPDDRSATTVVQHGTSSLRAIQLAGGLVAAGAAEVVVAGGVEVMSLVPMGASAMGRHGYGKPWGERVATRYAGAGGLRPEALRVEAMAARLGISRRRQDDWAGMALARAATPAGCLDDVVVVAGLSGDETRRITPEALAAYPPMFTPDGTVTAGNHAPIGDGAALVVLASGGAAARLGIEPIAELVAAASVGRSPLDEHTAMPEVLRRLGRSARSADVIELHEGFAAGVLATIDEIGLAPDAVNRGGGALALGHPLGASGARMAVSAVDQLRARGHGRAVAVIEGEDAAGGVLFER